MFGEIACVTLSVYFMKKIRTAMKGTKEVPRRPAAAIPTGPAGSVANFHSLTRSQKAAILLVGLPAEISAPLCKHLGPQTVQALVLEINRMPEASQVVRTQALLDFLGQVGLTPAADQAGAIVQIGQLGERDPQLLGRMIQQIYLQ
jgi:hypothetical protein